MAVSTIQEMLQQQPDVKFKALEILAGEIIYGDRVLDPWDKRCLNTLFKAFFCKELSSEGFSYLQSKVTQIFSFWKALSTTFTLRGDKTL